MYRNMPKDTPDFFDSPEYSSSDMVICNGSSSCRSLSISPTFLWLEYENIPSRFILATRGTCKRQQCVKRCNQRLKTGKVQESELLWTIYLLGPWLGINSWTMGIGHIHAYHMSILRKFLRARELTFFIGSTDICADIHLIYKENPFVWEAKGFFAFCCTSCWTSS